MVHVNFGNNAAGGICLQPRHFAFRQERDIRVLQRRLDTNHMRICFRVHQTRKAVARRTTDALALMWILFVQKNANRQMEGLVAEVFQIVTQLLNSQLMADRWKSIRLARGRFRRIFASDSVDLIQILCFGVIRLQVFVC